MATFHPTATPVASVPQPQALPTHLRRIYRGHITPQHSTDPERTFFVEAATHQAAARKIAGTIAVLEYTKPFEAEQAVYNITSAFELVRAGVSDDLEARVFETGASYDRVCSWVTAPVFLVRDPAPLTLAWLRVTGGAS